MTSTRSLRASHEERHGEGEQRVLDELGVAHEVLLELLVVDRGGPERLEREPHEQQRPRDPERARRADPERAEARGGDDAATTTRSTATSEGLISSEVSPASTSSAGW